MRRRARVEIRGLVQGVYFRAETRRRAASLGVDGWVRNTPEGTVEAAFEGDSEQVERLLAWCRRGPAGAVVEDVSLTWEEPTGESGFRIA